VRVLLIGNNYCGTPNELYGCCTDIDNARAWFTAATPASTYALSFKEYSDRKNSAKQIQPGPDGTGTGANILAGINWLVGNAKAGDILYMHYSGHGSNVPTSDLAELDHVNSAWVPIDYKTFRGGGLSGLLLDNELRSALVLRVPTGASLWVTSDSCFSGSVLDLRFNYTDASFRSLDAATVDTGAPAPWRPALPLPSGCKATETQICDSRAITTATTVMENKAYAKTTGNVVLLSGCTDRQAAADAWEDRAAQGALSWALFSCLQKNKEVPVKYLLRDVRALLRNHGYVQTPQLSSGGTAIDLSKSASAILLGLQ
jgi:hypothetical protein